MYLFICAHPYGWAQIFLTILIEMSIAMIEISGKANNISSLIPKQKFDSKKQYRPFKYIVESNCLEGHLLLNVLTRELLFLTGTEYNDAFLNKKGLTFKKLVSCWFFVPTDFDDYKFYNQLLNTARLLQKKDYLDYFVILPTTECNARCFYCFENGILHKNMSPQTAVNVAKFIENKAKGHQIKIQWFGGEPLCNTEAIDIISKKLGKNNISFSSWMITNGFAFNDEMILKAAELWKLQKVQITLDGTEKNYNRIKNYKSETDINPFQKVILNINNLLSANIAVTIRLNMDIHNHEDLFLLIDFLDSNLTVDRDKLNIYPHILYDSCITVGKRDESKQQFLNMRLFELDKYITSKRLSQHTSFRKSFRLFSCLADNVNSIVILPDGKLSKCDHKLESEYLGTIDSGIINQHIINLWQDYIERSDRCHSCELLPQCLSLKYCRDRSSFSCDNYEKGYKMNYLQKQMMSEYKKIQLG